MLMAGVRGLEPRSTVLETAVLILLDYTPILVLRERFELSKPRF